MRTLVGKIRSLFSWSGGASPYRVYTRDFDKTVKAEELGTVLGPLSDAGRMSLDEAWLAYNEGLAGWRTKMMVAGIEATGRISNELSSADRSDVVVTLLIDQSGSMRGQNMLLAATAADVARNFIMSLGAKAEVLGFTTVGWKGGRSRRRWQLRWGLPGPGRLCDLLHIIYMDADNLNPATGSLAFKPMLRHDLPKENIDGEAIEWAITRLRARPETRKILLVLSDGVPVDDSTLLANGVEYLSRHLRQVVTATEADGSIEIAAIGLEQSFDKRSYYSKFMQITDMGELGTSMIGFLERLVLRSA